MTWSLESLRDLLPHYCVLCNSPAGSVDICDACFQDLPWLENSCVICALPVAADGTVVCNDCQRTTRSFSCILAPLKYEFPVDVMINRFKHRRRLADGALLAHIMAARLRSVLEPVLNSDAMLVPVPLHPKRLRERGFNQALILAEVLSKQLGVTIKPDVCQRTGSAQALQGQNHEARQRSVKGAFRALPSIAGRQILLVDDVVTSCATVTEVSKTLLAAGAEDIVVLSAARTPSNSL